MASDKNNTNKETRRVLESWGGCCLILREVKKGRGRGVGWGSNVRVTPQAVPCHRNLDQSCRRQRVYLLAGTTAADGEKETGGLERQREE